MELTPMVVLDSFLAQAKKMKMAVVVFAGFADGGQVRFLSKHTLNEGTEKAFLGKFLATDDAAVEAAARAIGMELGDLWSNVEKRPQLFQAAKAAIEAARNPERSKILGPGGNVPS